MKTKHTQGEWYVGNIFPLPTIKVNGKRIATISKDLPIEERESNASLIAAAPEMLELLIELKTHLLEPKKTKDVRSLIFKTSEIIKKATE